MNTGDAHTEALKDHARGWRVIDVPFKSKNPGRPEWQNERLEEREIRLRFSGGPRNVAVLLGEPSNHLTDMDLDMPEARFLASRFLPETSAIFGRLSSPESHWLYYVDSPVNYAKFVDPTKDQGDEQRGTILEMRSTGQQTIFPGSVHPTGENIAWARDGEPAKVDGGVLHARCQRLAAAALLSHHWAALGARQDAALALAGGLVRAGWELADVRHFVGAVAVAAGDEETEKRASAADFTADRLKEGGTATGWPRLAELVGDIIVRRIQNWLGVRAGSDAADAISSTRQPSQADQLVMIGKQTELFADGRGVAFVRVNAARHFEIWPLRSNRFKSWLLRAFYLENGKAAGSDAVNAAIGVLEGLALYDGEVHALSARVARAEDGSLWYDLVDGAWRALRIDAKGWVIVDNPPPLLRRYSHAAPQTVPLGGGDPWALFHYLNVREEHRLLLLVWLIAALIPDIPHPIVEFFGEQGSGKSVGQHVLRRLIDPSVVESLTFPSDVRELVQQLSHHYAPVYDNVDNLPPWLSDVLCRAVTGEGFTKRELYSDDDDIIYEYRRVILLNGINVAAQRPDLLDRIILIGLERIVRERRRDEASFWLEFEAARPFIFGGLLDVLVRAIHIYDTVQLESLERMADFTRWGAAITVALGKPAQEFLQAYGENVVQQNREAVEANIVGNAIITLMKGRDYWTGSPTDLLAALEEAVVGAGLLRRTPAGKIDARGWPGAPHILTRRLNDLRSNLRELGYAIVEQHGDERNVEITRVAGRESSVGGVGSDGESDPQAGPADATDATDATSENPRSWEAVV